MQTNYRPTSCLELEENTVYRLNSVVIFQQYFQLSSMGISTQKLKNLIPIKAYLLCPGLLLPPCTVIQKKIHTGRALSTVSKQLLNPAITALFTPCLHPSQTPPVFTCHTAALCYRSTGALSRAFIMNEKHFSAF